MALTVITVWPGQSLSCWWVAGGGEDLHFLWKFGCDSVLWLSYSLTEKKSQLFFSSFNHIWQKTKGLRVNLLSQDVCSHGIFPIALVGKGLLLVQ